MVNQATTAADRGLAGSGRGAELRAIAAEPLTAARAVLLTGEPGIGKSWLLEQAAALVVEMRGARRFAGYALALTGTPPQYPLARAFTPLLRDGFAPDELREARAVLASAGIGPPRPDLPAPPPIAPEAEQFRVFDAVAEVCAAVAARQPLVVTLDDMQWAAPYTWDAVQYLLRALQGLPVLLLLAAREELLRVSQGAGAQAVAELSRLRLLTHLPLQPLPAVAIAQLSADALGGAVSADAAALLAQRSEGNPFFAEEVLRDYRERGLLAWRDGAWQLDASVDANAEGALPPPPPTLHLAIAVRLDRLPQDCEQALAAGAVLGRAFSARTLGALLGSESDALAQRLRPAEAASIVDAEPGGWRFRHDTIRETLLERHAAEAGRLHAAAAVAIAQSAGYTPGFETLTALAHHWQAAEEPAKAGPAALAAARAAMAAHLLPTALDYARTAHASCTQAGTQRPAGVRIEAATAHGEVALAAGVYSEAADAFRAATHAAAAAGEDGLTGRAWMRLGTALRRQELADEAADCYAEALRRLDEEHSPIEVTETLIAVCDLEGLTRGRYSEARAAGERAGTIAARLDDRGLQARATLALANVETRAEDPAAGEALLEGALAHALAADDTVLGADICASLANACYWRGALRRSQAYAAQRLQLAQAAADPFALRHAHSWLALLAATRGEWEQARALLNESERALAGLDSPEPRAFVGVVRGLIAFRLGALEEAYDELHAAISVFEQVSDETPLWYAGLLALVCVELGRDDEARAVAAAQERRLDVIEAAALPARSARCMQALVYVALGDRDAAERCEAAVVAYAGDFHWSPARRSLAALAVLRGDREAALGYLALAEALARTEGLEPDIALSLFERAALLPPDEAQPALEEARALFARLGMQHDLERCEALLGQPGRPATPAGLSPREVEVLRLIAQGLTNREIAARLVISERTVANHLSHIFDKIAVENRASAAAFAFRNGLA